MGAAPHLTRAALESAMRNGKLVLYYQPKVHSLSGRIIGAEALVRWSDGENLIFSPDRFLPLAEDTGLLHDLTLLLLDQVVEASVSLRHTHPNLSLSINVAPNDLASRLISNRIEDLLSQCIIEPDNLQIEITESAVMGNVDDVYDDLLRLKSMHIKILMDDFGTGYSSIDRLSQLPFDALKLDQGVVRRMGTSRQNLDVVRSAISMARELDMKSVAEGVESAGAFHFLIAHGCDELQGYYIAKPMSLASFKRFLNSAPKFEGSQIGRVHMARLNLMRFRKNLLDASFCRKLGGGHTLESVAYPVVHPDVTCSRLGQWYFGVGSSLSDDAVFQRIETPLRAVHKLGVEFIGNLRSADAVVDVDSRFREIDRQCEVLLSLFHELERQLLHKAGSADA